MNLKGNEQPRITISFTSVAALVNHIEKSMPIAVKTSKKAGTSFVYPFSSRKARQICVDAIVESFIGKKLNKD